MMTTTELKLLDKIHKLEKKLEDLTIENKKQLLQQAELTKNLHESVLMIAKYLNKQNDKKVVDN